MAQTKLRTALSLSLTALFVMFGAAMLALILPSGGWKALSVQTGSMKPVLNPGDLVLVHSVPASNYQVGDVITFINPENKEQTITHRIVQTSQAPGRRQVFQTKGDANNAPDRLINETAIVGRQEVSVPLLGRVIDFLHTIPGLLLVIWLPALWIIFGETKRLADYYRRVRPYLDPSLHASKLRPATSGSSSLTPLALVVTIGTVLVTLGFAVPAFAAMTTQASLTNTIIAIKGTGPPVPPDPPKPPVTCSNNTNVNVNSSTNQSASTGNASSSNNTNGGSATSGNASNSSLTSININVNNGSCTPAPAP